MEAQVKRSFEEWMKQVDRRIESVCWLSSADLPDICYRDDLYDDGVSPGRAAAQALRGLEE